MISIVKRYTGLFLLVLGVAGIGITSLVDKNAKNTGNEVEIVELTTTTTSTDTFTIVDHKQVVTYAGYCHVDVKGEVKYPGVYLLRADSRIDAAIMAAGGLTESADTDGLNLAQFVYDQMVVYVGSKSDQFVTDADTVGIDIKGEVNKPGFYEVEKGSRIYEVIELASGLTELADTEGVNLALVVEDQMVIVIPAKDDDKTDMIATKIYVMITGEVMNPQMYVVDEGYTLLELIRDAGGLTQAADIRDLDLGKVLLSGENIKIPRLGEENDAGDYEEDDDDGLININDATLDELMTLPGIGMVLGQRIIDYRAEFGDFLAIEDIMFVSGIKESVYEDIRDQITVGNG